ncbi:DUF4402 domain-containing protein [Balneolaceae bacterium ANBcel3]|nr:DUF4402 domain-containing protein [Balneolaceae bacterium ANBcel3]
MKRILSIVAICSITALSAATVQAQSADATADVTATVMSLLNIEVNQDVVIGQVMPGTTIFMDSNDEDEYPDGQLGRFEVTGIADADVEYSYNANVTMEGPGSAQMNFETNAHATHSEALMHGQTTLNATGTVFALSSTGKTFVFIGGTLVVDENQEAGDYTGQVTLTAEYH